MPQFSWVDPVHMSLGLGLLLLTASGWFAYFWSKEHGRTEERWLRLAAIVSGCLAVFVASLGYRAAESWGWASSWQDLTSGTRATALRISLLIGVVEEAAKLLLALPIAWTLRRSLTARGGIVLAACAGVGFATAESAFLMSLGEIGLTDGLARAAAAPITHALFAAPWGLGLAATLNRSGGGSAHRWGLGVGFAVAVSAHALYDFLLSRPTLPPVAAAGVVLALWIWVMMRTAQAAGLRVSSSGIAQS